MIHQARITTIRELKDLLADWPETDVDGEPTEVYSENADGNTVPGATLWTLNYREIDGRKQADLLIAQP